MKKIEYLNGLRGLAAFIVVFHHFILAFYPALFFGFNNPFHLAAGVETFLSGSVFNLFYNGNFAVCIFFILSGFVLSYKFLLEKNHAIITESVIKRYIRLVIPVAVSIFCAFFLMKLNLFYNQQAASVSGSDWLRDFWAFTPNLADALNQIFVGTFFTNIYAYNAVLWTIGVEFFGSLLVFAFLAFFGKMRNRRLMYILAILFFFETYYLAFILGIMLSDIMAHRSMIIRKFDKNKFFRTGLLFAGLFLGAYPSGRGTEGTIYNFLNILNIPQFDIICHIVGAFFVILVLLDSKKLQKMLSLRFFLFLGEISFAMYLMHFIIIGSFGCFIFSSLAPYMPYAADFIISFILSVALIFAVSYFVYLYVDKKAIRLSKFIYARIFG